MFEIVYFGVTHSYPSLEEAERVAENILRTDGIIVGIVYIPSKVPFDKFYGWRNNWYANHKCGARIGQDFCNHFHKNIGRGEHTRELFFSVDSLYSEQIIYTRFILWS